MANKKIAYSCQSCGAIHFKWAGKCPDCGAWNSLVEEFEEGGSSHFTRISEEKRAGKESGKNSAAKKIELVKLSGEAQEFSRIKTNIGELDRVLGGGLVQGSVVLIGGDPGIGKSTLLLQTAESLAKQKVKIIYISGEESVDQVRLRAKRMGVLQDSIEIAATTNVAEIVNSIKAEKIPTIVIIDSIQTMFLDELSSAPGTVSQVRAAAGELTIFAKKNNITLLIVSHVTKDGQIAGPKVLEHMVDTVLYFEGEKDLHFRILRAQKNRFGAASEIGVFEMNEVGLSEVSNPSELFLTSYENETSGACVFAGIEGTRPILVEIQSLVSPSFMPTPRRAVVGWDINRLAMIIAVLNNRFGLNLFDKEVYLNVVGGLKIEETSADLAVACALISAARDIALPSSTIAIGEIGLSGEIRMISNLEGRLKEAAKLGFRNCLIPKANEKNKNFAALKKSLPELNLQLISHVRDLAKFFKKS
ncbi:MAG: DNA repair protein RadA [Alphaproteobacteria bacterium RIFCSPLOWO2_01_FULL_40_26]|nr:MAG: DNA repair protein RadA [Alphaproteobacteria bacterium RIFCSPHIGHO2_02_FULL_40_34]OFW94087.1 MAG: DNA repair protein RadA [Alphaproteobacteria bacterium RIFCSPLOWO2_01_FULL_40_26]OFX10363.1 MAG: DNA repair protein RadA [Alphaproteobacteria bacterium RIFCSPLOWO2_02_FULL_40_19]OFX11152.1 MAG: DNA repair protein RadA [Alphaproteobacteria bacterium RIFCSPLOWO2_12_FULL_40_11]